jgi:GNAT superfamily N-acetyltransferase
MDPAPEIRLATAADRDVVTELLVAQLRDHAIATPAADLARTVDALLSRPHRARFLLAVAGARTVGLAAVSFGWPVEHGGRGAWLEELFVVPEARGRGTGTRLLDAAIDVVRHHGAVALDLEVERGHERAASLYRRHGFTPLERTRWVKRLAPAPGAASTPAPAVVAGGCFCGAVRYEIRGPLREASHCHCASCRRTAGAPVVTWATYPRKALRFTRGSAKELHSSPPVTRTFCAACGTPLTYFTRDEPEWIDVTVGSMDDPGAVPPADHIWTASQLGWLIIDDDLPRWPRGHGG